MKRDKLDIVGEICIRDDEGNLCLSDEGKGKGDATDRGNYRGLKMTEHCLKIIEC